MTPNLVAFISWCLICSISKKKKKAWILPTKLMMSTKHPPECSTIIGGCFRLWVWVRDEKKITLKTRNHTLSVILFHPLNNRFTSTSREKSSKWNIAIKHSSLICNISCSASNLYNGRNIEAKPDKNLYCLCNLAVKLLDGASLIGQHSLT